MNELPTTPTSSALPELQVPEDSAVTSSFTPEQLHPMPEFAYRIGRDYLLALGCLASRTLILLDIEKLMTSDEMDLIAKRHIR
jgi:chemotaxis signal transduction protein